MKSVFAIIVLLFAVSMATAATLADFSDSEEEAGDLLQAGSLDLQLADFDEDFGENLEGVERTWHYSNSYPGGMAPGDSLDSVVYLKNAGSLRAGHLDVYALIQNAEIGLDTPPEHEAENAKVGGKDDDDDGLVDEDPLDGADNDGDGLVDEDLAAGDDVPLAPGYGIFDKDRVMIVNYMKYQNASAVDIVWADGFAWDVRYIRDVNGDGRITLYDLRKQGRVSNLPPPVSGLSSFSMKVTFGDPAADLNEYQLDETRMTLIFALFQ